MQKSSIRGDCLRRIGAILFGDVNVLRMQFKYTAAKFIDFRKGKIKPEIHRQVLLTRPVLRWCFLPPYVPLTALGSANVPAMNSGFIFPFDRIRNFAASLSQRQIK